MTNSNIPRCIERNQKDGNAGKCSTDHSPGVACDNIIYALTPTQSLECTWKYLRLKWRGREKKRKSSFGHKLNQAKKRQGTRDYLRHRGSMLKVSSDWTTAHSWHWHRDISCLRFNLFWKD